MSGLTNLTILTHLSILLCWSFLNTDIHARLRRDALWNTNVGASVRPLIFRYITETRVNQNFDIIID